MVYAAAADCEVCTLLTANVGKRVGPEDGERDDIDGCGVVEVLIGNVVGEYVGTRDGLVVGSNVGLNVGSIDGLEVGNRDGVAVGWYVWVNVVWENDGETVG